MSSIPARRWLLVLITSVAAAQMPARRTTSQMFVNSFAPEQVNLWMTQHDAQSRRGQVGSATEPISALDLKAPGGAKREYRSGLELINRRIFERAVEHLLKAVSIYPQYVAAHSALGCAYLELGRNEEAEREFRQSVRLDDHLPNSYRNLGRAEMALSHYAAAEESLRKASAIAPLDLSILTSLTYAAFLNHDFPAAIATAQQAHSRVHEGAAIVHYFAAASWQSQKRPLETRGELQTLLAEDPGSPAAEQARRIVDQITKQEEISAAPVEVTFYAAPNAVHPAPGDTAEIFKKKVGELQQENQVAEAEAEPGWENCGSPEPSNEGATSLVHGPDPDSAAHRPGKSSWTLRSSVDEVALFFAVTDHGKSVSDLKQTDISIRDDQKPLATVLGFRNESQLPLRLGLVIDTSASIQGRFAFEQKAAINFLQRVMGDKDDLAFVVGFSNSVLLVQDFTSDADKISHGVNQLAPVGGTAAWDAVTFAAQKLASLPEERPVARILVVVTDGDDNSSAATLKEAIEAAQGSEVIVYTVSTREDSRKATTTPIGDRALKALAARTGGAAFFPGSLGRLNHSLEELQQVIRSRYLISYKPTLFSRNGEYRTIDINAQKAGRKLRVYARRGYYASTKSAAAESF